MYNKNEKGITLIELIVVMAISTILLGAIFSLLISNQRLFYMGQRQMQLQGDAQNILERVSDIAREASAMTSATSGNVTTYTFTTGSGASITTIAVVSDSTTTAQNVTVAGTTYRNVVVEITPVTTATRTVQITTTGTNGGEEVTYTTTILLRN